VKKLGSFGVEVLRPTVFAEETHPTHYLEDNDSKYIIPPMTPRDHCTMIGNTFFENFLSAPGWENGYEHIVAHIRAQGNHIHSRDYNSSIINGAMVSRIGKDLYFGTELYTQDQSTLKFMLNQKFRNTRNHIVNTGGHSDGSYCPVCPGLILSLKDMPIYNETFPDWEVVYVTSNLDDIKPFLDLKEKNHGKWWIPGFEYDQDVIDVVDNWMSHWTGYVEETVFDINMLIVDPKNVIVVGYHKQVFDALERYGITPHIVPFRHRWFWDGGIHCVTSDLDREGTMQNYFPQRG